MQVLFDTLFKALECRHERFGYVASAEWTEAATIIRHFAFDDCVE